MVTGHMRDGRKYHVEFLDDSEVSIVINERGKWEGFVNVRKTDHFINEQEALNWIKDYAAHYVRPSM